MNKHNRSLGDNNIIQSPSTVYNHHYHQYSQYSSQSINTSQPCKSPSPDKKRANIITPTKSPQLIQIKRNMTPLRLSQKKFQKTPIQIKPSMRSSNKNYHQQSTKYYTNQDFQQYRSSQRKNQVLQQLQNMMPEQFMIGSVNNSHMMSQYRSVQPQMSSSSLTKQLDYIKLLQQKQRTIKQLHQIIQMINRNNSLDLSASCGDGNLLSMAKGSTNKKIFQTTNGQVGGQKLLMLSTSKIQSPQSIKQKQQLKQQIKTLTIQNQQLIHMIQKLNNNTQKSQHLNTNINTTTNKQSYTQLRMRQQKLLRQLNETRQKLQIKQSQCKQLQYQNKQLINRCTLLDLQNQKLIKMMKQKQLSDRKYHASLIQSTLSIHKSPNQSQLTQVNNITGYNTNTINNTNKQRLTLVKIKQQYNQSLKVFKDTVCGDVEEFMAQMGRSVKCMEDKIVQMEDQVRKLERFKIAYEQMKQQKKKIMQNNINKGQNKPTKQHKQQQQPLQQYPAKLQMKRTDTIINEIQQLSQIQMTSPQKMLRQSNRRQQQTIRKQQQSNRRQQQTNRNHRQIQSLIMDNNKQQQYYQQLQKQLQQQKRLNSQYQQKIISIREQCEQLYKKYNNLLNENNKLQQNQKNLILKCQQLSKQNQQIQVRLKLQMRDSRKKNQQIQDINIARAQQKQIKTLRQMIIKYQQQLQQEKAVLMQEINVLIIKGKQYDNVIEMQKVEFLQKQGKIREELKEKQYIIQQLREQMQERINQLQQQLQQMKINKQQLQRKLSQHQQKTQLKLSQSQQQLKQKQQLLNQLKQTLIIKQHNQTHTHQQIQKLIQNYQKQINILKQKTTIQQQRHYQQLQQKNVQIRRLIIQGENVERLMQDMESNYNKQVDGLKQRVKTLVDEMDKRSGQEQKVRRQHQQLMSQHNGMKQTIDRLLQVAKQVEQMQQQNKLLTNSLNTQKQTNTKLSQTIQSKQQQINNHKQQIFTLNNKIQQLTFTIQKNQQQINQLKKQIQQHNQITNRVRKQSQQIINQRQYDLAREENKHYMERLEYEGKVERLMGEVVGLAKEKQEVIRQLEKLNQRYIQLVKINDELVNIKGDDKIIDQLYQLRALINTNLNKLTQSTQTSSQTYNLNKLVIDYQSKCDQIITLNNRLQQNNSQIITLQQQKSLLQQKINCLQKNIFLYQNEIKQRKIFTDKLLLEKTKLQKEIVLVKKGQIQTHKQQSQTLKINLMEMINKIVKMQQLRDQKVKNVIKGGDTIMMESPIRRISGLMVEEKCKDLEEKKQDIKIQGFQIKKVDNRNVNDNDDEHQKQYTQGQQQLNQYSQKQ